MYTEIVYFIAKNWKGISTHLQNTPLLKYVSSSNNIDLESVSNVAIYTKNYISSKESNISWLTKRFGEFGSATKYYFILESTQKEIINLDLQEG